MYNRDNSSEREQADMPRENRLVKRLMGNFCITVLFAKGIKIIC